MSLCMGLPIEGEPPHRQSTNCFSLCVCMFCDVQEDNEREVPNSDVYIPHSQNLWKERCNRCCACMQCFTCNLFGGAGTRHDSMSVVARVFSRLFYGSPDLVISDIVAGFILLAAVQAHEESLENDSDVDMTTGEALVEQKTLAELRGQARLDNGTDPRAVVSTSSTMTVPGSYKSNRSSGDETDIEYSSISIPPLSTAATGNYHDHHDFREDRELGTCIEELAHFSKFAVGIYGWMLYVWSHPWSGTFRLAFSCMKRNLPYIHGDNWFHLGQTALQLETKVRAEDIVYASFANTVYRPAFCVVLDHTRKEVVIAIRGTLSLEDCLTDAIAYGISMNGVAERWGCDGTGEYAHQGFLHCAEAIYLELNRLGILEMLLDPNSTASIATDTVNRCERGEYHDYGLVVTGHSLGAGTSVLLSVMLRPKYPNLRCFAFSPPGCTMSPGIARRCAEYTVSVVVGDDIIARSSLASAEALRDQVLDLIRRSKVGKVSILRQVVAWKRPDELLHDEHDCGDTAFSMHLSNYRTMLQRIQASEPISPLTIPGRLVHLRRSTRNGRSAGGCWVCCRPGADGVCCTSRSNYQFAWSSPEKFNSIRIARTMLDDHFPDKVHYVLQDCVKRGHQACEESDRARLKAKMVGEQTSCLG